MNESTYHSSSIRSILWAIILFIVFLIGLCQLTEVVKVVGNLFLNIPAALGYLRIARPDEVQRLNLLTAKNIFLDPDAYLVYTDNPDLLEATDMTARSKATPWLTMIASSSKEKVPVTYVERGVRPYDSYLSRGRAIYHFVITRPDRYELTLPRREADLYILPDTSTGKETTLLFFYLLQLAGLTGIGLALYWPFYRRRRLQIEAIKKLKSTRGETFWKNQLNQPKSK